MKKTLFIAIAFILLQAMQPATCQEVKNQIICLGIVLDGDTVPYYRLKEITITSSASLLTDQEIRKNQRLIRNVKDASLRKNRQAAPRRT